MLIFAEFCVWTFCILFGFDNRQLLFLYSFYPLYCLISLLINCMGCFLISFSYCTEVVAFVSGSIPVNTRCNLSLQWYLQLFDRVCSMCNICSDYAYLSQSQHMEIVHIDIYDVCAYKCSSQSVQLLLHPSQWSLLQVWKSACCKEETALLAVRVYLPANDISRIGSAIALILIVKPLHMPKIHYTRFPVTSP